MSFNRDDNRSGGFRGGFSRGGGRGGFGGGRSSFGGDRGGDRPMYKATCSNCGKECEVPFRPTNGKPVYCSECFEKMGNGGRSDSRRPEGSDFRAPSVDQKAQFDALNAKLEKIISLLEPKKVEVVVPDLAAKEVKEVKAPKAKKAVKKVTSTKKV
jgi:CxxC-x17-CxxC domain-containing protein